jgi:hypothetical protein
MTKIFQDYKTRLAHLKGNYDEFLIAKIKEHTNKIIIDEIQARMEKENFSPKIIQSTILKDVEVHRGRIKIKIKSEYTSESGFDVALAREKGTKDHMVYPNTKQALSWIIAGKRFFSRGHKVSGIKSLKIIEKTIKEKKPELKDAIDKEFDAWLTRIFTE